MSKQHAPLVLFVSRNSSLLIHLIQRLLSAAATAATLSRFESEEQ
jgi:hypothetical protein